MTPTPDPLLCTFCRHEIRCSTQPAPALDARSASPVTTWFRDDCECSVCDPDGDGCYLTADFADGLCRHCHGHALAALMPAAVVAQPAPALDVTRLARAMTGLVFMDTASNQRLAASIAAEYALGDPA